METHSCGVGGERKKIQSDKWLWAGGRGWFPCSREKKGWVGKGTAEQRRERTRNGAGRRRAGAIPL